MSITDHRTLEQRVEALELRMDAFTHVSADFHVPMEPIARTEYKLISNDDLEKLSAKLTEAEQTVEKLAELACVAEGFKFDRSRSKELKSDPHVAAAIQRAKERG